MTIIKCTNCSNIYQEEEINIIECKECKTDSYLMELKESEVA
tara:strand:- start:981 stop:1106 length:126 start_codon:yes stop_codon:yes gene_type:complete